MFGVVQLIIDCRFFTIFAVGGTLLGSVLCFLEVTFLISFSCYYIGNIEKFIFYLDQCMSKIEY